MRIIADLQIHSRYARACSKDISIENLEKWARVKGLDILGVGDFQHPLRRKEIDERLKEDDKGILRTDSGFPFLWQTEVSLMYAQDGKRRAVHLLVFAPNTEIADAITAYLGKKGRLDYDGRPIFGIPCNILVQDLKAIDDRIEIIPAHAFTPWFGLYGSQSGFDSLKQCFQDQVKHIYAVESGMSADPSMIWRLKEDINIVSFSDAHSFWPWRLGREATIFEIPELSYTNIMKAIRTGDGLISTIETPPEYGKYHWDGHRNCNFSCSPMETKKLNGLCPICKQKLTIGVDYRIESIAKENFGYKTKEAKPFYKLLPLHELLALHLQSKSESKKTWALYNSLIEIFGNEFKILLDVPQQEFVKAEIDAKLITLILNNRAGKIHIKPGFDGVYGVPQLEEQQKKLF
jgi:uncharacterized protein (TIGR00375 family)